MLQKVFLGILLAFSLSTLAMENRCRSCTNIKSVQTPSSSWEVFLGSKFCLSCKEAYATGFALSQKKAKLPSIEEKQIPNGELIVVANKLQE